MERTSTTMMTAINDDEDWRLKKNNINRRRTEGEAKKKYGGCEVFFLSSLFSIDWGWGWGFSLSSNLFHFFPSVVFFHFWYFSTPLLYGHLHHLLRFSDSVRHFALSSQSTQCNNWQYILCVVCLFTITNIIIVININPQMHRQSLPLSGSPSWRVNYQRLKHTHTNTHNHNQSNIGCDMDFLSSAVLDGFPSFFYLIFEVMFLNRLLLPSPLVLLLSFPSTMHASFNEFWYEKK